MNVDHHSGVQTWKHLQIEKWDIAIDPQGMAGFNKQNVVFLELMKEGNLGILASLFLR